MLNLKGNTLREIILKSNLKTIELFNATYNKTINLIGSVEQFTQTFSIKMFVQPIVNIYSKININRYAKTNIFPKISLFARLSSFKPIISSVQVKLQILASAYVRKNIKSTINFRPIIGKDVTLGSIDSLMLSELDVISLGNIGFTEGVRMNVVKNTLVNVLQSVEIYVDATLIKYLTLGYHDSNTLGSLDGMTLGEMDANIL